MRLLENQAKQILSDWGIPVPRGAVLARPAQLSSALRKIGGFPAVVKAQVYAGGRGKGGGILKVRSTAQAREAVKKLLGKRLVTPQTGPQGVPVKSLLIEEGVTILKELYVGILLDRSKGVPIVVAAKEGGVAIEELAAEHPESILSIPFDPLLGLIPHQARRIAAWLGIPAAHRSAAVQQLQALAKGFLGFDASLVEVNPWAVTGEHGLAALDAKITLDDNGLFRHPQLERWKTADCDTPMEAASRRIGISYVGLTGTIGCMVNGAGLAMATMDLIKLHGSQPANFLDVGGGADTAQVREAFKLIVADPKVKAILVNIFGGIMKCDVIAAGILSAAKSVKILVPLVVRLEGTNVEPGRKMLETSKLGFLTASDMDEAARKVVEAASGVIARSPTGGGTTKQSR